MRIGTKIGAAISVVAVLSLVGVAVVLRQTIIRSFRTLEEARSVDDVARAKAAIAAETEHLAKLCRDWAHWDDACDFIEGKECTFEKSNLANPSWFIDNDVLAMAFVRTDGTVFWQQVLDPETHEKRELSFFPTGRWPLDHVLLDVDDSQESNVSGLVMTESGPWLVSAQPILTSEFKGPRRGILVFARPLDQRLIDSLAERTKLEIDVTTDAEKLSLYRGKRPSEPIDVPPAIDETDADTLVISLEMDDLLGRAFGTIKVAVPRTIMAQGKYAYVSALIATGIVALATITCLSILLRRIIVRPIERFAEHTARIGTTQDLLASVPSEGTDELSVLAAEFNEMLAKLRDSRTEAVDLSRRAGMAEAAIGVLHNVGNVLQSVVVSAIDAKKRITELRADNLRRAADMLQEHAGSLDEFIGKDPKGSRLIEYFRGFAAKYDLERNAIIDELQGVSAGIDQIHAIVEMQQSIAKSGSVFLETVGPSEIVDEIARIHRAAFERHEITFEKSCDDLPELRLDRHKITQILGNLVTNAKAAVEDCPKDRRRIALTVERVDGDEGTRIRFTVTDTGRGIAPDTITKLFKFGFTTRADGHGFGLHASANAAAEMGGKISVKSAGCEKGAEFALDLPYQPVAEPSPCR